MVILKSIFSHIHLSPGLVHSASPPTQRQVESTESVTPEHAPFLCHKPLVSTLPTFPCSGSSIPLGHKKGVTSETNKAGYTMGPSSGGQVSMRAWSLSQNQMLEWDLQ